MMKKLLFIFLIGTRFLFADYLQMQTLLDTQSAVAVAVNSYVEARGVIPASVAVLKSAGYLPNTFNAVNPIDGDPITFAIANNEIRMNSNLESSKVGVDDADYYTNTFYNRELGRYSSNEGGVLISYYSLTANANANNLISSLIPWAQYKGDAQPQTYTTPSTGSFWFSSTYENDMYELYTYTGSVWGNLEKGNKNFNSILGTFTNQAMIPLLKSSWNTVPVTVNTLQKAITCATAGTTYNPLKDRCEAYTSSACGAGDIFRTGTGSCDVGDNSACTWNGGTWNGSTCQKGSFYSATETQTVSECSVQIYMWNGNQGKWIWGVVTPYPLNQRIMRNGWEMTCHSNGSVDIHYYGVNVLMGNTYIQPASLKAINLSANNLTTTYTCPSGGTLSGTTCSSVEYFAPACGSGLGHDGQGRCAKAPTCASKTMPVSPFSATPYYGNNGVCYSDAGLYCKTYGVAMDGSYTCFNTSQTCNDSTYTLRSDTDVCEKYSFTCNGAQKRYGLPESPTNNNATDLYNRITNKDTKLNAIVATMLSGNVDVNDNNGAMCTNIQYTTLPQPTISPDYSVGGELKSGF